MNKTKFREIPYNYTSADDELIIRHLFDDRIAEKLDNLRSKRVTGRSAKLLMRLMGDMFLLQRNPFIFQALANNPLRKRRFFSTANNDLAAIESMTDIDDVMEVTKSCRQYLKRLGNEISSYSKQRRRLKKVFGGIIGRDNVFVDPFTLISHATDATDWRRYLPLAVLRPTRESQVPRLLKEAEKQKLKIIPRGAGTGLTGGAVPVTPDCVIINTEKLNRIHGISEREFIMEDGTTAKRPVMMLETGVITQNAMEYAEKKGLVFATDPTSSWACTVGGNIAENAGGKKAVMWGTAIDNLLAYKIAMPGGKLITVKRNNHPFRKILPDDTLSFSVMDETGSILREIKLAGTEIRKKGLGKDITNKALSCLPGVQKEGTDGIITSAEFVLYKEYAHRTTFCIEFFGEDMEEASRIIVEISREFVNEGKEALIALEHFDDEYMEAINYKVKAPKAESPKAALLIDMVGHNPDQIRSGTERLENLLSKYENSVIFVAKDNAEAERFWQDRKKLGAISARTNAFKLNEDIVLPLDAIGEFTRFADDYNIKEERYNQESFIRDITAYIETAEPIEDKEWLIARLPKARELCTGILEELSQTPDDDLKKEEFSGKLLSGLTEFFRGYNRILSEIREVYSANRARRIVIATHMHAGDGNVHVNIPVFSNDMEMMKRASETADAVMFKAVELDGVVSGEHGIGITKMKYLDQERIDALNLYREEIDPDCIMNPGQLKDPEIHKKVFTPSFNLLELEARILQHSSLEELANRIAKCVRCGKCKIDCCTFYPSRNLFFHPRNKNLAIASLIEAILYDVQRSHSTRFRYLKQLEEIADHCTICHKCLKPCPVNIDTGEVSILEREILQARKFKHSTMATSLTLKYLQSQAPVVNMAFRQAVVKWGGNAQRLGHKIFEPLAEIRPIRPIKKTWPMQVLKSPVPPAAPDTLRAILPACRNNQALVINPEKKSEKTVFYFPGCGSERLFSDISKASLYILLKTGAQVVLPPPFLCCGFPLKVNAKTELYSRTALRNSIMFSQITEMLSYINFDACIVSCGTCLDALREIETDKIFDCPLTDVSMYAIEKGVRPREAKELFYHAPCHDSLEGKAQSLLAENSEYKITGIPDCCSEAGTMSLSRPDISNAMLKRKSVSITSAVSDDFTGSRVLLTNCPSCIQGLGRNAAYGLTPKHLAVELAEQTGGPDWEKELLEMVKNAEAITF